MFLTFFSCYFVVYMYLAQMNEVCINFFWMKFGIKRITSVLYSVWLSSVCFFFSWVCLHLAWHVLLKFYTIKRYMDSIFKRTLSSVHWLKTTFKNPKSVTLNPRNVCNWIYFPRYHWLRYYLLILKFIFCYFILLHYTNVETIDLPDLNHICIFRRDLAYF